MLIKHNSFFSYNGAHRYASTFIPWGHVYLNDKEMIKYSKNFIQLEVKDDRFFLQWPFLSKKYIK